MLFMGFLMRRLFCSLVAVVDLRLRLDSVWIGMD